MCLSWTINMYIKHCKSFFYQTALSKYLSQPWSAYNLCRNIKMVERDIVVTVKQGQLRGKTSLDHEGNVFYSFQGIPYAKPPIGNLRFKAPQPPESWSGIRQATEEGSECYAYQRRYMRICGSEDCLYLNVHTPELPSSSSTLKPVMVWIHGGAFTSGSGSVESYGPGFLIVEDVVVVLLNFRYGLLGFLSLEDPRLGVPGNAGLKDQILALKWIKENIKAFNGDPENVTVFGESSGGASVHYLILSPMAKGLFHKAIIQSGSALCCWARGKPFASNISPAIGHDSLSDEELLKILQEMSVEKLYEVQQRFEDIISPSAQRLVGPVVEKPSDEPGFLLEDPLNIMLSGTYNKVPMIIGYTSREGMMTLYIKNDGTIFIEKDCEKIVPYTLNVEKGSKLHKQIAKRMKEFYFGDEDPSEKYVDQYSMLMTDTLMLSPINETAKIHAVEGSTPVYYYRMSVDSKLNKYKSLLGIQYTGVCHGDDLGYLFKTARTPKILPNSIEDYGMKRFVKLWTNFAKKGDPNPIDKEQELLINVKWNPVKENELNYLDIGENLTTGINPESFRVGFWSEITKLVKEK